MLWLEDVAGVWIFEMHSTRGKEQRRMETIIAMPNHNKILAQFEWRVELNFIVSFSAHRRSLGLRLVLHSEAPNTKRSCAVVDDAHLTDLKQKTKKRMKELKIGVEFYGAQQTNFL